MIFICGASARRSHQRRAHRPLPVVCRRRRTISSAIDLLSGSEITRLDLIYLTFSESVDFLHLSHKYRDCVWISEPKFRQSFSDFEGLFPPESEGRFLLCNVGSSGGQWAALLRLLGLSPLVSSVYLTLFSLSQRTELIRGGPTGEWRFMLREIGHLSLAKLQHLVMILRAKLSVKWNRNIYSWAHLVQPHFPSAEADLLQLI